MRKCDLKLVQSVIGDRLRKIRESQEKTLYRVAVDSELALTHYRELEEGLRDPRLSTLAKIMEALGMSLQEFFSGQAK